MNCADVRCRIISKVELLRSFLVQSLTEETNNVYDDVETLLLAASTKS